MNDGGSQLMDVQAGEAQLPELIRRVEKGEEIVLCRSGEPAAKSAPIPADFAQDDFGPCEGEIWIDPGPGSIEPLFFAAYRG